MKASIVTGAAEGGSPLNAFDNALLAAGLGNVNIVKISSILPPEADVVDLPRLKPGSIIPTAYATVTNGTSGMWITAAIGYARSRNPLKAGVIMEYHGESHSRATAEQTIRRMLHEALTVRGEQVWKIETVSVDHRVLDFGCVVAAIPLLLEEVIES